MIKRILISFLLLLVSQTVGLAQACGELSRPITLAEQDWPSAQFHTAVAKYILEKGFGCDIVLVSGSALPLLQELTQGNIDVMMEVWQDAVPESYLKAKNDGLVIELGLNMMGVEGFFVPKYLLEDSRGSLLPDLKAVTDILRYSELFAGEQETRKGIFYNCVKGWQCEQINDLKLELYGLTKLFTNYKAESWLDFEAAILKSYEQKQAMVFYHWGPTWLLGELDVVMLDEQAFDAELWQAMKNAIKETNPDLAITAVAYPSKEVHIVVSKAAFDALPAELLAFLTAYSIEQNLVSDYLAIMRKEKLEPNALALRFLQEQSYWESWLSAERVKRVRAPY